MPRFGLLAALLLILLGVWGGGGAGVALILYIRPGNAWLFCSPVRQVRTAKTTSSSRLSVYFQRICSERKYFHKSLRLTRVKSSIAKTVACVAAGPRIRLNHLYICIYRRVRASATQATKPWKKLTAHQKITLYSVSRTFIFFLHRESYYF